MVVEYNFYVLKVEGKTITLKPVHTGPAGELPTVREQIGKNYIAFQKEEHPEQTMSPTIFLVHDSALTYADQDIYWGLTDTKEGIWYQANKEMTHDYTPSFKIRGGTWHFITLDN